MTFQILMELTIDLKTSMGRSYTKLLRLNLTMNIINKILCLLTISIFDGRFIFVRLSCVESEIFILKAENICISFKICVIIVLCLNSLVPINKFHELWFWNACFQNCNL